MRRTSLLSVLGLVAALAVGGLGGAAADHEPGDTVPPEDDNGAQGRDNGLNAGYLPPPEACAAAGDRVEGHVERVLPEGPRADDGRLLFTSGICVYTPPGYDTDDRHLPVVYLLHGGGGDHGAWFNFGAAAEAADAAALADPDAAVIVVTPDGADGQWMDRYDRTVLNETYLVDHLIPWMDRHYRTIPTREGRAVTGLSNGGYGSLLLAAKHPDLVVAAGSMSGNLGWRVPDYCSLGCDEAPAYRPGNTPADLASNLDDVGLILHLGTSCTNDLRRDLCASFAFEQLFLLDNEYFVGRLEELGHPDAANHHWVEGGHAWVWWSAWWRDAHLPFLLDHLADPTATVPPGEVRTDPFRHRSVAPDFSVWGWTFSVDRDVREFLDVVDASAAGVTLRGSGRVEVVTAALFAPGAPVPLDGAIEDQAVADEAGRLRFTVDLGPSHQHEQYSNDARLAEAVAGDAYWTTRAVAFGAG